MCACTREREGGRREGEVRWKVIHRNTASTFLSFFLGYYYVNLRKRVLLKLFSKRKWLTKFK